MVSVLKSIRAVVFRRFFFFVLPSASNSGSRAQKKMKRPSSVMDFCVK